MQILNTALIFLLAFALPAFADSLEQTQKETDAIMRAYVKMFDTGAGSDVDQILSKEYLNQLGGKDKFLKKLSRYQGNKDKSDSNEGPIKVAFRPGMTALSAKDKSDKDPGSPEVYFAAFERVSENEQPIIRNVNGQWFVLKRNSKGQLRITGTMLTEGEP